MELLNKRFFVSHGQISVFKPGLANPFNDWTERHFAQGFAWRGDCVSFLTVDDGGSYRLTACRESVLTIREDSASVIRVPWYVGSESSLIVANIIGDKNLIQIESGSYQLQYECSPVSYQVEYEAALRASADSRDLASVEAAMNSIEPRQFIHLSFAPNPSPLFEVLRADGSVPTRTQDLLLTASPA